MGRVRDLHGLVSPNGPLRLARVGRRRLPQKAHRPPAFHSPARIGLDSGPDCIRVRNWSGGAGGVYGTVWGFGWVFTDVQRGESDCGRFGKAVFGLDCLCGRCNSSASFRLKGSQAFVIPAS